VARKHAKPPISSHGLFPVIVAIWFAALFGLGSLVLPTILLERIATGSGLAWLFPAAAPPLGVTARIALSSSAAVAGALLGFVIARRVARAQAYARPANVDRRLRFAQHDAGNRVRRPISAREELGSARVDAPAEARALAPESLPGRRRALAMTDERGPSQYLQRAPLPGDARWADDHPLMPSAETIAEKAMAQHGYGRQAPVASELEPLELARYAEPVGPNHGGVAAFRNRPIEAVPTAAHHAVAETPVAVAHPAFASPETSYAEIAPAKAFAPPQRFATPLHGAAGQYVPPVQPQPQAFAPPEPALMPGEVNLPFTRPAAAAQQAGQFAAPVPVAVEDEPLAFVAPSQLKQSSAAPHPDASSVAEPLRALIASHAPPTESDNPSLGQLGMIELAERLGRSMQRRKLEEASPPAPVADKVTAEPAPAPEPDIVIAAPAPTPAPVTTHGMDGRSIVLETDATPLADEVLRAFDRPAENNAPPPPVIPAALRPLSLELEEFGEDEDEEEFATSLSLPFAGPSAESEFAPLAAPADEDGEEEVEGEAEEESTAAGYSSLLAMKNPFRGPAEFVRIELPEPEAGAIEPAVVFPGHSAPRPSGGNFTTPSFSAPKSVPQPAPQMPEPGAPETAPRRFDAPVEAAEQAARRKPQVDPAETERALRSALATLQRMSGAA
jgi:hypothetical protein